MTEKSHLVKLTGDPIIFLGASLFYRRDDGGAIKLEDIEAIDIAENGMVRSVTYKRSEPTAPALKKVDVEFRVESSSELLTSESDIGRACLAGKRIQIRPKGDAVAEWVTVKANHSICLDRYDYREKPEEAGAHKLMPEKRANNDDLERMKEAIASGVCDDEVRKRYSSLVINDGCARAKEGEVVYLVSREEIVRNIAEGKYDEEVAERYEEMWINGLAITPLHNNIAEHLISTGWCDDAVAARYRATRKLYSQGEPITKEDAKNILGGVARVVPDTEDMLEELEVGISNMNVRAGKCDDAVMARASDIAFEGLLQRKSDADPDRWFNVENHTEFRLKPAEKPIRGEKKPDNGSDMPDTARGIYPKYLLKKVDGSHVDPKADYFVLRLDKDDAWGDACRRAGLYLSEWI